MSSQGLKLQGIRLNVCRFLGVELLAEEATLFGQVIWAVTVGGSP